ncbi:hypothetical protein GCM10008090_19360 [Arenicella chitinivorans]|uniref:Uncharacterized protein n=1 Tax=Arenicella chitinivorans TaxID=1329800 RepID=A0A918RRL0_9GAMM|nr:Imm26 family immunity protein [Arenicella chitinivorans]GHA09468.1 hypothetical protein GCM10008090_19360 [Arenicella chitinivorans]
MKYPFTPKSTSYLEPGHFWSIPLSNGRFACGVVVSKLVDMHENKLSTKSFLAALIDWSGNQPPTQELIKGCDAIKVGEAHIKAITTTGSCIVGRSAFGFLGENPRQKSDDIVTMGYNVLRVIAENRYAKNS